METNEKKEEGVTPITNTPPTTQPVRKARPYEGSKPYHAGPRRSFSSAKNTHTANKNPLQPEKPIVLGAIVPKASSLAPLANNQTTNSLAKTATTPQQKRPYYGKNSNTATGAQFKNSAQTASYLSRTPIRAKNTTQTHTNLFKHRTTATKTTTEPKEQATSSFNATAYDDIIRIIPLGGVEEVGKNMTVVEYKGDIVIIDMGLQFPGEETPGVDYIIPDTTYLQKKKKNIKGVFITHGHLDHIGAIPYMMERLGNPPIYTRFLPSLMIKKRQEEFSHLPALDLKIVEKENRIKVGEFLTVRFFNVTHTIPESMGVIIETPYGNIVFTGDVKIDHDNNIPLQHEVDTYSKLGAENNLVLLADSTNVEKPGWSFSERMVHENLKLVIAGAKGRLIIGTFASLLERIIYIIKTSEELGKKVVLRGKSMKGNVAIATEIKMLDIKPTTIIPPEDIDNYPPDKIVILATGAQGDEMAALMRMATKKDKYVKINKTDVVLLSSSIIPGNEKSVQKLKDNLSRQGAKIIHYKVADVHSSGHANYDETLWLHKMIKPKYFIPVHGHHFMLRVHAEVAKAAGMREENIIVPDNGMIIEISDKGNMIKASKDSIPSGVVMVDGLGNGDVNDIVIRDRQVLAQDGMFVIIAVLDVKTGKVTQSPDIISRGFIYLKESQELLRQVRILVKKTIEGITVDMHPVNLDYVKNHLREKISKFLFQNTAKRPIIIPVLLEM
ncbi:MAG: ribonuclease J [bacterium]